MVDFKLDLPIDMIVVVFFGTNASPYVSPVFFEDVKVSLRHVVFRLLLLIF